MATGSGNINSHTTTVEWIAKNRNTLLFDDLSDGNVNVAVHLETPSQKWKTDAKKETAYSKISISKINSNLTSTIFEGSSSNLTIFEGYSSHFTSFGGLALNEYPKVDDIIIGEVNVEKYQLTTPMPEKECDVLLCVLKFKVDDRKGKSHIYQIDFTQFITGDEVIGFTYEEAFKIIESALPIKA